MTQTTLVVLVTAAMRGRGLAGRGVQTLFPPRLCVLPLATRRRRRAMGCVLLALAARKFPFRNDCRLPLLVLLHPMGLTRQLPK